MSNSRAGAASGQIWSYVYHLPLLYSRRLPLSKDPRHGSCTRLGTTRHARTGVHHARRLHLRTPDSATRQHGLSDRIRDRRRSRYEEPKSGTTRRTARTRGSGEHRVPRERKFRCFSAISVLSGTMEDLHVTGLGEWSCACDG